MKKTLLISAAFLFIVNAINAQSSKIKFGIHAGMSIANMKYEVDDGSYSPKRLLGIQGGLVADVQLNKHLSLQPGVNLVQKGMKYKSYESASNDEAIERINVIEIPVNVLYNSKGAAGNFFMGAGPSVSFALAGKYIDKTDGETDKENMSFGNNGMEDDYRAFDFGLNGMIGYELKGGFFMAANYNLGLRNLIPGADEENGKIRTNYIGIRLGYFFNGK